MIVIGESNATGGGIKKHRHLLYHRLFSQWWDKVISPTTGTKLTMENLSLRGTRNDFCLQNFITPDDEPDIVFIELSVNDYEYIHIELLTRRILSLKSFPLVLYVSLVNFVNKCASLSSAKNPRCHNSEEFGQRELATHYGITLLS